MTLVAVGLAACAGAVCRYLVDLAVQGRTDAAIPLGTLLVNVTGSAGLGFVAGLGLHHGLADTPQLVLGTGFLGAYTTFSTFAYETVRLMEDGSTVAAWWNVAAGTLTGLAAAGAGLALAAAL